MILVCPNLVTASFPSLPLPCVIWGIMVHMSRNNPKNCAELWEVVSINEAAAMWGKHRNSVLYLIDHNRVRYRQLDGQWGMWIISLDDLIRVWGDPVHGIPVYNE